MTLTFSDRVLWCRDHAGSTYLNELRRSRMVPTSKNSAGGFAPGPPLRSTLCMAIARSARQRRCVSHSLGASVGRNLLCRAARDGHAHSSSEQTILRKLPTFQSQAREANKSAPTQSLGHVFFRAQLEHSPCGPSLRRRLGDKLGPKNFGFGLCHILCTPGGPGPTKL